MNEKIFCGSAKIIETKYGELTKIFMTQKDILRILGYAENNDGYTNLVVSKRKETSKAGSTHCVYIDTWKPDKRRQSQPEEERYADSEHTDDVNQDQGEGLAF